MRFFLGDDNGQLKSVCCTKQPKAEWKVDVTLLDDSGTQGINKAIQKLAVQHDKVVVARGDGSVTLFAVEQGADSAQVIQQWQETRFTPGHKFVGLGLTTDGRTASCTTAGHLRMTQVNVDVEDAAGSSSQTSIPNRLCEWVLSTDSRSFAYGGDEVEVSVWDMSRAFDASRRSIPYSATGTKRRKGHKSELIDGEVWRARNVCNDFLNLRQPVHNTSLAYLSSVSGDTGPSHHLIAGTRLGSVRRYDIRAARRPIADWKDVGKVGGIKRVQRGHFEHEAFVADHGNNLYALDLRTGHILCAFKGLAGAISSVTPPVSSVSPPLLASTSLDRFFRLHGTHHLGDKGGGVRHQQGDALAKVWVKSAAGCIAWDGLAPNSPMEDDVFDGDQHEDGPDVWADMESVGDEDDGSPSRTARVSEFGAAAHGSKRQKIS